MGDSDKTFYVYWLQSGNRCYYGATVNPSRRLRQHNGLIKGGSNKTRNRGPWHFHCVIEGFQTWNQALSFEWAIKFYTKRCRSIVARQDALVKLHQKERWTSNCPLSKDIPLIFHYAPTQFGLPPEEYVHTTSTAKAHHVRPQKRRKFKRQLHGVKY